MSALAQSPLYTGLFVLVCLAGAALFGGLIRTQIAERHRSRETIELIQVSVTMLVTFASIVLGLLVSSSKTAFDTADGEMHNYAIKLIELDRALRDAGPVADDIRAQLRAYTAAAIASTWSEEPSPKGDYYPRLAPDNPNDIDIANSKLGQMINKIGVAVVNLPQDGLVEREARNAADRQFRDLDQNRWYLLSVENPTVDLPFLLTLVLWMVIVFACFGLTAPTNPIATIIIILGAAAIASAMYVIVDLNTLFDDGIFSIPSTYMHQALRGMEAP
ncbi:bestrophin-like domain [Segnochrobactrum spirostomi]|uniref:DUF4239 domain-containing protein n=1 Tax=Segnochrobactrum spirostomi TaxID=2608987 RepID=A0A6A7XYE8_9HYPH|nr:hypothetical protein [Segnochrobactrum spirostomi]MQT11147.1 hypothetical protein [Segnochrobactrum spirostomi]